MEVPAAPFFESYRTNSDDLRFMAMRLCDLLTMTAGIKWDEDTVPYTDPANSCAAMEASRDWVQFVLAQPMADPPGARFVYSSGVTELLAQVAPLPAAGHPELLLETHADRASRHRGRALPRPSRPGELGYLYMWDGVWEGRRLLPEGWVAASTAAQVVASEETGFKYGYQWWVIAPKGVRPSVFAAIGYGGQHLLAVPSLDLIAVFTGWNIWGKAELDIVYALESVLKAVKPLGLTGPD